MFDKMLESIWNVCYGDDSQKFSYCFTLSFSAPGVSLMTRMTNTGTFFRWQTWAMDADSMSTARASGKCDLISFTSSSVAINLSPEQIRPYLTLSSVESDFKISVIFSSELK